MQRTNIQTDLLLVGSTHFTREKTEHDDKDREVALLSMCAAIY